MPLQCFAFLSRYPRHSAQPEPLPSIFPDRGQPPELEPQALSPELLQPERSTTR
ncbi:hypothetical protein ElyMa_000670400, partial [Elysia marginata]